MGPARTGVRVGRIKGGRVVEYRRVEYRGGPVAAMGPEYRRDGGENRGGVEYRRVEYKGGARVAAMGPSAGSA